MANEILSRDQNHEPVMGAVTDAMAEEIRMARIDDATKGLKVILVGGTGAGTVTSITATDSITATPNPIIGAGTISLVNDTASPGNSFYYGTNNVGTKGFYAIPGGSTAYNLIQNNGVSVTQETTINLSTLLLASDVSGKTALTINTANLANDSTFISTLTSNSTFLSDIANSATFVNDLIANTTFTTNLANNTNFISTLTSNSTFLSDIANSATFVNDLIANTTFTTNLANNTNFISTLTSNSTFLSDIANSATFVNDLIANTTFTTNLANNTNFISTLTNNTTFQNDVVTFINNSTSLSINLITQVTGILPIAHGGTNSGTALSGSSIMISNGTRIVQGALGTTTTVLHGNASGAPTYSAVALTTDVSGVLPVANGGTGDSSFTAYAPVFGGTTTAAPLQSGTVGSIGQVLTSNGPGVLPTFQNSGAQWISEGVVTWSNSNTTQTITFVNSGRSLYQIFYAFSNTNGTGFSLNIQVNGDTSNSYSYTTVTGASIPVFANTTGQSSIPLFGGTETTSAVGSVLIGGNATGPSGGRNLYLSGSIGGSTGDVTLFRGNYSTAADITLTSITFSMPSGQATGKAHIYSLAL